MGKLTISMAIFYVAFCMFTIEILAMYFQWPTEFQWLKPMCPICSLPWQKKLNEPVQWFKHMIIIEP